jgi:hypothetical protein
MSDLKDRTEVEACLNCRFYYRPSQAQADSGYCRRYPRVFSGTDSLGPAFQHVTAAAGGWCGEWKIGAKP